MKSFFEVVKAQSDSDRKLLEALALSAKKLGYTCEMKKHAGIPVVSRVNEKGYRVWLAAHWTADDTPLPSLSTGRWNEDGIEAMSVWDHLLNGDPIVLPQFPVNEDDFERHWYDRCFQVFTKFLED